MKKSTLASSLFAVGALLLAGCQKDFEPVRYGTYKGYQVARVTDGRGRQVQITDGKNHEISVIARDSRRNGLLDGRFDTIYLGGVPVGHPIEGLVTLKELEGAYNAATNQTSQCFN
jgi:hypothetical protein